MIPRNSHAKGSWRPPIDLIFPIIILPPSSISCFFVGILRPHVAKKNAIAGPPRSHLWRSIMQQWEIIRLTFPTRIKDLLRSLYVMRAQSLMRLRRRLESISSGWNNTSAPYWGAMLMWPRLALTQVRYIYVYVYSQYGNSIVCNVATKLFESRAKRTRCFGEELPLKCMRFRVLWRINVAQP